MGMEQFIGLFVVISVALATEAWRQKLHQQKNIPKVAKVSLYLLYGIVTSFALIMLFGLLFTATAIFED
jgi:hypothetical protein